MEDQPKADIKPVEPIVESTEESKTHQEESESLASDNQQENAKQAISEVTGSSAVDSSITNESIGMKFNNSLLLICEWLKLYEWCFKLFFPSNGYEIEIHI